MREMTLDELVNHHGEIHRARTELIALHSRLTASEAQLCRAREAWAILTGERLKYVEAWPTSKLRANDAMEAALSSIAPCPHEAKVKEAEGKLDAVVISHDEVVRANIVLEAKVARLEKGLKDVEALINESSGVAGLHLNGEIAEWGDLRTGGVYEEWLRDFDAALAAKEGK